RGTDVRTVPLAIAAGAEIAEHFELAEVDATFPVPGRISIATDPPGARVTVDGEPRGISPITVDSVSPATHTVRVSNGDASAERAAERERAAVVRRVSGRHGARTDAARQCAGPRRHARGRASSSAVRRTAADDRRHRARTESHYAGLYEVGIRD